MQDHDKIIFSKFILKIDLFIEILNIGGNDQ